MGKYKLKEPSDYKRELSELALPQWLLDEIPEPYESIRISYDGSDYVVTVPESIENVETGEYRYDNLEKAYDAFNISGVDVEIDKSVPEWDNSDFAWVSLPSGDGYSRLLFSSSWGKRADFLEMRFAHSQRCAATYHENPQDFLAAYGFVTTHPVFWLKSALRARRCGKDCSMKRPDRDARTFDWDTDCRSFYLQPFSQGKGNGFGWLLEAGGHTPDFSQHYHDVRLDVFAPSVEEAYIQFAALLVKFFEDDGTEKDVLEDDPLSAQEGLEGEQESLDDLK